MRLATRFSEWVLRRRLPAGVVCIAVLAVLAAYFVQDLWEVVDPADPQAAGEAARRRCGVVPAGRPGPWPERCLAPSRCRVLVPPGTPTTNNGDARRRSIARPARPGDATRCRLRPPAFLLSSSIPAKNLIPEQALPGTGAGVSVSATAACRPCPAPRVVQRAAVFPGTPSFLLHRLSYS